jgi:hypothetical protein
MADKDVTKKPTRKTSVQAETISKKKDITEQAYTGKTRDTEKIVQKDEDDEKSLLKDILSISGQGGLFKYISQARNGIIVESLETGRRMNAFTSMKVNSLKDIAIFTSKEEIPLEEVFKKIYEKENGGKSVDHKEEPAKISEYFSEIVPEYDKDRVYVSDIRKVINWYNILHGLHLLKFDNVSESAKESKEAKQEKKDKKS